MSQQQFLEKINELQYNVNKMSDQYWMEHSNVSTWQFWYHIALIIIPLAILYRYISKERFFEVLFYGYSNHVIFNYLDSFMVRYGYWDHPYMLIPQFPFALSINASLYPILYMLLYQYCTNKGKNFYLWSAIASFLVGVIWVEIHKQMNIFQLHKGITNIHTFIFSFIGSLIAFWATKLFLKIKKRKLQH